MFGGGFSGLSRCMASSTMAWAMVARVLGLVVSAMGLFSTMRMSPRMGPY